MQQNLEYKYDDYQQDFHQEDGLNHDKNDKNIKLLTADHQLQTEIIQKDDKKQSLQEEYQDDFVQAKEQNFGQQKTTPKQTPNKKIYDNTPNREKMIQQNIKLKTQIYELAKQMDQIVQREKKNKKYGIHADEIEDDETMKIKKAELKKQQVQILNLKNKIFLTKRQLEHVYDSRGVQGKEDQLKNLQKQLKTLQDEKQGLLKVKKQQTKALKLIRNDNEYEDKVKSLKESLMKLKQECKGLNQKLIENERVLRKNHESYIMKQAKIKEMELKIKENKEKAKKAANQNTANTTNNPNNSNQTITNQMIQEIDSQIAQLQKQRKQTQKTWNEKIQLIQGELQQKRVQEEKNLLILKEKEKELKLNQIRIKELRKLIQHHTSQTNHGNTSNIGGNQNNGGKKNGQEAEGMKEYRHKRNIKHLEK